MLPCVGPRSFCNDCVLNDPPVMVSFVKGMLSSEATAGSIVRELVEMAKASSPWFMHSRSKALSKDEDANPRTSYSFFALPSNIILSFMSTSRSD